MAHNQFANIVGDFQEKEISESPKFDVNVKQNSTTNLKQKEVADQMYSIGEKFAKAAIDSQSISKAKTAFDVAERAYRFAFELDSSFQRSGISAVEFVYIFLSGVDRAVLRSSLWRCYSAFCEANGFLPITKGSFFKSLEQLDFRVRKSQGDFEVVPPRKKPPLLIDAAEKRKFLIEGDFGLRVEDI